jgi:hypothetical protein
MSGANAKPNEEEEWTTEVQQAFNEIMNNGASVDSVTVEIAMTLAELEVERKIVRGVNDSGEFVWGLAPYAGGTLKRGGRRCPH